MAYTTIDNPELYFQVKTYTGTGSSNALTLDGDENMQPDLVWIKSRSVVRDHVLTDSVRGIASQIHSNTNDAESTYTNDVTSFDSDGFTVSTDSDVNGNTFTYVAWCWKESADSGFDIVSYTGNGSNRTISHSLSQKPSIIIAKSRTDPAGSDGNWFFQHGSLGATKNMVLNSTNAVATFTACWNDTEPTSSVFTVGTDTDVNENSIPYIAYLFAEKQGFSKFGSYTGNGNADGTFVYTGFKPAFVMVKRTSGTQDWNIFDATRPGYNPADRKLEPNTSDAESGAGNSNQVDLLSNGFKRRGTGTGSNGSGDTYIYMAIAEASFVNSNGVPCNAR
jgi:hypothetical protein